ncbi:MAG: carbohydrate ABC transporter permease [Puniceicoccaceae bacterium]|nr:MAG: carbohydrate ABC transporter permease [Puniceicoccaceae bacterium]
MPIISPVEAKTPKGRILLGAIFVILTLGGLTMVYPFLLMVSGALRSELDETDLDLVPAYWTDTAALYKKYAETKYNQSIQRFNRAHRRQDFSFRDASLPPGDPEAEAALLTAFFESVEIPGHWVALGGVAGIRTVPENLRALRNRLADRFDGDLDAFNRATGGIVPSWQAITLSPPDWVSSRFTGPTGPVAEVYRELLAQAPLAEQDLVSISGFFLETMVYPAFGQTSPEAFNLAFPAGAIDRFRDFVLPPRLEEVADPGLAELWIEFTREELHPSFVLLDGVPEAAFQAFLRSLHGTIDILNRVWNADHPDFAAISLPAGEWLQGSRLTDYQDFLLELDPAAYRLVGPEYAWRDWLAGREPAAHPAAPPLHPPMDALEKIHVLENAWSLRRTYSVRNFINVFDELFLRGRAFLNTIIFCTLSVIFALLVNPMAAYAMSRFKLPGSYKFLLLMMATMAFPPMVTLIPTFIILQQLSMMNTFAALVLPTIANGYLIFLLKGFFDSLPTELYEAATIDGASELRIFFQITMMLSTPILAVVGLMAFNGAYTMFLYPLLVAPREDMWLLSVWLYQFQLTSSMGGVFASVLISAVPTLLVFIFAQNIIMRGIVIPVEK